ncbi:MAG: DUF4258 domain-containing protein [Halobacteriota archaeon]
MGMVEEIKRAVAVNRYNITSHAKREMMPERDDISEKELVEAILDGEIIEDYPNDKPCPSCLVFGRTRERRPIHAVCALSKEDDIAIIITAYEPDLNRWVDYRYRRDI